MRPSTVSWRNLNPNLNIDSNPNPTTNPAFKPLQLRRLTSSIGEPANPSTGEENGVSANESSYLDSIAPVVPNATLSSNTYQPSHRESYPPPFANLSSDFSSDLFSRKRLGLDPSLSPVRIARALVGTEEILSHMAVSPPSEKTKVGTPPASPNWTTVSHGSSSKQGATAPLDESVPPILPSPKVFTLLVEQLEKLRLAGNPKPLRSLVGCELNKRVYAQAGVQGFSHYVALAERMGIVELGGIGGKAWIGLQANWRDIFNKDT
ncbi:hypothetical protein BDZ94DRAFT_218550 [Collybia nuda]|uniref:Uncharacterized protein n=1 Tax=Collybia nuda TaxID=64659 RepID=A0A9P5YAJ6_9AGAR|nr:hypothetical protein BDZ94DRAFT_218550 [Collybia nuda]